MLAGFCVATAVVFHTKFGVRNELLHFEKDFAIAGGLLVLFAHGAGEWALDALRAPEAGSRKPDFSLIPASRYSDSAVPVVRTP